jgi:hypothetical protein
LTAANLRKSKIKRKKAPRSLRDAFPSEYPESAARSRVDLLHFCMWFGLLFSGDFLVSQVKQPHVEQQNANGGERFVF